MPIVESAYSNVVSATPTDPDGIRRVALTVGASGVSGSPSAMPVLLDLSAMPAEFWDRTALAGADLRVTLDDGTTQVPRHVLALDRRRQKGWLAFHAAGLSSGSDATFYLYYGTEGAEPAATATNGSRAVWSDFALAYVSELPVNAATGLPLYRQGDPLSFREVALSPDLGAHQGVDWDGTHYYVFDSATIRKYDVSWAPVAENAAALTGLPANLNHLGDGCVYQGVLYVPAEQYDGSCVYSDPVIARYDAATLALVDYVDVSAQGSEVSSCAVDPLTGSLFVASYCQPRIEEYDLGTLAYRGGSRCRPSWRATACRASRCATGGSTSTCRRTTPSS